MQNLPEQIQTSVSQKQKTFSRFFIVFLEGAWNLENIQKEDEYPRLIISEIVNAEKRGYLNV